MLLPAVFHSVAHYAKVEIADILHRIAHHSASTGAILHIIDLEFRMTVNREIERIFRPVDHVKEIAVAQRCYFGNNIVDKPLLRAYS